MEIEDIIETHLKEVSEEVMMELAFRDRRLVMVWGQNSSRAYSFDLDTNFGSLQCTIVTGKNKKETVKKSRGQSTVEYDNWFRFKCFYVLISSPYFDERLEIIKTKNFEDIPDFKTGMEMYKVLNVL